MRPPPFNPDEYEAKALRGATPFQRATIEAIDRLFRTGQRRVLVADEVGLGKTLVARGVIAKLARLRKEEHDDLFKVAYVCSSLNIVRQNLARLDPDHDNAVDPATGESRLSMQHLLVTEGDEERKREGKFIQRIPITPETSFRLSNNSGTWKERALIAAIVCGMEEFRSNLRFQHELSMRLCGSSSVNEWQFSRLPKCRERVGKLARETEERYPACVWEALRRGGMPNPDNRQEQISFVEFIERMVYKPRKARCLEEIGILRHRFAEISADMLQPDLVILDEFQRFRYLIDPPDGEDGGEVKVLFDRFLGAGASADADPPRILMLSATPFKLYSTRMERGRAGEDISFREFKGLIDFLFDAENDCPGVWQKWEEYIRSLSAFDVTTVGSGGISSALLGHKAEAEESLRRGICRTERTLVEEPHEGGAIQPILPEPGEIRAWVRFSEWMGELDLGERLTLDYAKSAPYVLSFLGKNYEDQTRLESALRQCGAAELAAKTSDAVKRALWINPKHVKIYREIPWANARLKLLAEHAFDKGAERLLWVPPTLPCYEPGGPFAGSTGYSKTLVFSKWQMVPKMAAALLSYEAERRTVGKVAAKRDYSSASQGSDPLLFRRAQGGVPATMYLFTLLYPSRTLADAFSPASFGKNRSTSREVAATVSRTIRRKLADAKLPNPAGGRIDKRWYYLAPMFLDGAESSRKWCQRAMTQVCGNRRSAMMDHYLKLVEELAIGPEALGRRPSDLCEVLSDMALGSPGVCLLRAGLEPPAAIDVADAFREHFNTPEAIAAVDCSYPRRGDDAHWRNVLLYARDGCLQSVLDEYLFLGKSQSGAFLDSFVAALRFRTTTYRVDTFNALCARIVGSGDSDARKISMRTRFAAAFADGEGKGEDEKGIARRESLRTAFNSPFRPFVLVSTSIGQEGLDFHGYCRKVFHWNLPHNPVDLEQREGRVDRYRGLAVRQNVAAQFAEKCSSHANIWPELFKIAEAAGDASGLLPNWRNGPDAPWRVERIVPLYACSEDEARYKRLIELIARFRAALGQPNQEDLLDRFLRFGIPPAELRNLFLDLCPFRH